MPGAIADASTLINLALVDHLELLREFHGKITVPPAVNGTECELYGKMAKWRMKGVEMIRGII